MANNQDDIVYKIGIDNSEVKKKNKETKDSIKDTGESGSKSLNTLNASSLAVTGGFALLAGGAVALAGSVKLVSDGIKAYNVQARAENKLESVLKSTKNVAGLTALELKNMASELQNVTAVGDETILNAQALMLTFTNIGSEIFPKATEAALNMSHILGTDLISSTTMLSKALNDPIAGISAMSRAGVQFTQDQKDMIKELVNSGKAMKAQTIILNELETQFGNSARNFRDTFEGTTIAVGNYMGDLSEKIGEGFTNETTGELNDLLRALTEASPELESLAKSFGSIAGSLVKVPVQALTGWVDLFKAYSAGSTASITNEGVKRISEATDKIDTSLKRINFEGQTGKSLEELGGISNVRMQMVKALTGERNAQDFLIKNDLLRIYQELAEDLGGYRKAVADQRRDFLITTREKTKDVKGKDGGTSKVGKETFAVTGRSDTLNIGSVEPESERVARVAKEKRDLSELRAKEQSQIDADNRAFREAELQAQIEYQNSSLNLINNSNNSLLAVHQLWASESTEVFLQGMSNLSNTTASLLENIGNISGNPALQAGSTALFGLGIAGGAFSLFSTIAGIIGSNEKQVYDRGEDTLDTSGTQQRASIVSNTPENFYQTNQITFDGCVSTESDLREWVRRIQQVLSNAGAGVV